MKKKFLSLLVGITLSSAAMADDLLQVYELAQQNDPTVNRAKANKNASFKGIAISRANLLPNISGRLTYSDSSREFANFRDGGAIEVLSNDTENANYTFSLTQTIYDHANYVNLNRAEMVAQQSDANYGIAKQDLIVRTTEAYLNVLRAVDSLEFVRAEKRAIERQLEQTKQRFEVGLTAITDVHEAQANFDNTVAQEIQAENTVELRREELREITGKYHDSISVLNTESFSASRPSPEKVDEWLTIAEQESLDLVERKIARDIAEQDIKRAKTGRLPTVTLNGSVSRDNQDITSSQRLDQEGNIIPSSTAVLPPTDSRSLSLSVDIPIFAGNTVSYQTAQARFNYVAASEDLELTHRSTVRSVRSSYNDVVAAISTIRALNQAVVSAQSALKATEAGFEVGTRTIVDVLNSTRNLYDARRNLAGARYDYIVSVIRLKRASGNLTENDVVQINRGLTLAAN